MPEPKKLHETDITSIDESITNIQNSNYTSDDSTKHMTRFHRHYHIPEYLRWIVLILGCLLLFGNYYCYDLPGALNTQLREYMDLPYNEWQVKMNSLYTAYSIPNLVMPLIGGLLIDSLGSTQMLVAFGLVSLAGQLLFTFGIWSKQFWLMAIGRSIFGMGGESLEVAQVRITTEWFAGTFLGLALGLSHTSSGIATALNDLISPLLPDPVSSGLFGAFMCIISLFAAFILKMFHKYRKRLDVQNKEDEAMLVNGSLGDISEGETEVEVDCESETSDETKVLLEKSLKKDTRKRSLNLLNFGDVARLPFAFWLVCLCTMTLYGAVNPFIHILSDLLQKKWFPNNPKHASALMSIPDLVAAIGSPLGGFLVDRISVAPRFKHLKSILLPMSGVLLVTTHFLMGFTRVSPLVPLFTLGLAYSLFGSTLWPLIPHFVTDKEILGVAYGACYVLFNISLAVGPQIVGQLLTHGGYDYVEKYFISLASFGILVSLCITFIDIKCSHTSNR